MLIYLKTTETCNLNCDHCYTSGNNGKKIYFNPSKTLSFLHRLRRHKNHRNVKILFHGGEPMLAPIDDLWDIYNNTKNLWDFTEFSITTNLSYKLTESRKNFFEVVMKNGMGSSYDTMRFKSEKSQCLFENNSIDLNKKIPMTLMVCISDDLIKINPKEILEYAISLGYKYILFERITGDGNASLNPSIFPSNSDQDSWIYELFRTTIENKYYEKIGNMFLSELASSYVEGVHGGNRCRNCEETIMTINADGTISGCPNSAPRDSWGHIDQSVPEMFKSQGRKEKIACESIRNDVCYTCEAYSVCNGDCYKLKWDGDYCSAPKKVWKEMLSKKDEELYKRLILK